SELVVNENARRASIERESRAESAAEIGGEHRSDLPDAPNRPPLLPLLRSRREKDQTSTGSCSNGRVRHRRGDGGLLGALLGGCCSQGGRQRNSTDHHPLVHAPPRRANNWLGAKQPFPGPSSILGESPPARE